MPPAYELLLLNTAIPQIQAAQSGDTYVVPRDIAFSAALTLSAGTANGVPYLNASKVLTTGSALTFDGTNLATTGIITSININGVRAQYPSIAGYYAQLDARDGNTYLSAVGSAAAIVFRATDGPGITAEGMRLTSTGLKASIAGTNADPAFSYTSDTNTGIFFPAADKLGFTAGGGADQMVLTSTGLGIGTNNPGQKLDTQAAVTGTYNSTTQQIVARFFNSPADLGSGVNSAFITLQTTPDGGGSNPVARVGVVAESYGSNNGAFVVATRDGSGVSEKMRLDSSGNLGLGVTPTIVASNKNLEIGGSVNAALILSTTSLNAAARNLAIASNFSSFGDLVFLQSNAVGGNPLTAGTQRMTLDASGNLLVGATSANSFRFKAVGTGGNLSGNAYFVGLFGDGSASAKGVGLGYDNSSQTGIVYGETASAASNLAFWTYNGSAWGERARITSGGNVEIGTSGSAARLRVLSTASQSNGFYVTHPTALQDVISCENSATSGDNIFISFYTDTQLKRGDITYNRAGGLVAYNTTSDYRAKDIIGPIQNVGATIDALKVYEGKMKGATQSRPMLVAHEAQEHAPYAVTGEKDAVNEDGTPNYQRMDVSSLVPLLLAEIQSLRARVAQLEQGA